jgi:major membrane immunogen (membrane-anchored lipoprotein)
MKNSSITVIMAATILIAGCGKKSPNSSTPPPSTPAVAASASPAAQPALTAWQQGDKASAVSSFLAADWSSRPLFAADSSLNLSEGQFKALSVAERDAKSKEMMAQIATLKQMAQAVVQAGHEAISKGDTAQARKCFTALKQCGLALESPDGMQLVQLVGKAFVKMSDTESAKIGQ